MLPLPKLTGSLSKRAPMFGIIPGEKGATIPSGPICPPKGTCDLSAGMLGMGVIPQPERSRAAQFPLNVSPRVNAARLLRLGASTGLNAWYLQRTVWDAPDISEIDPCDPSRAVVRCDSLIGQIGPLRRKRNVFRTMVRHSIRRKAAKRRRLDRRTSMTEIIANAPWR